MRSFAAICNNVPFGTGELPLTIIGNTETQQRAGGYISKADAGSPFRRATAHADRIGLGWPVEFRLSESSKSWLGTGLRQRESRRSIINKETNGEVIRFESF